MGVIWRENVTKLKISTILDFTMVQDITTVFLTMYRETIKCSILAIRITIDFTDI